MAESAAAASDAAITATDRFIIDGRSSRFTVRVFASGILAAMGHNPTIGVRDLQGEMSFDPEHLKAGAFRLAIKASSLGVQDDISDKDRREIERLMNQEVLETTNFPEILFEVSGITVTKLGDALYSGSLSGTLTLHGVARSETIVARVALLGSMLRASGEFSLSQSSYDIKPISVAGGALKVKDEVKCQFEIVARKPE